MAKKHFVRLTEKWRCFICRKNWVWFSEDWLSADVYRDRWSQAGLYGDDLRAGLWCDSGTSHIHHQQHRHLQGVLWVATAPPSSLAALFCSRSGLTILIIFCCLHKTIALDNTENTFIKFNIVTQIIFNCNNKQLGQIYNETFFFLSFLYCIWNCLSSYKNYLTSYIVCW